MARRGRSAPDSSDSPDRPRRFTGIDDEDLSDAIRRRIQTIGRPGEVVLVASGGDEDLVDVRSHPCWPFPQGRDGGWARLRTGRRARGRQPPRGAAAPRGALLRAAEDGVQLALPLPRAHRAPRDHLPARAPGRAPRGLRPRRERRRRRPPRPDAERSCPRGRHLRRAPHRAAARPAHRARREHASHRRAALATRLGRRLDPAPTRGSTTTPTTSSTCATTPSSPAGSSTRSSPPR